MELKCLLVEKVFTDKNTGEEHKYNALSFKLADGSTLEVTIKSDKAKLLRLSNNVNVVDKEIWEDRQWKGVIN